MDTQTFQQLPTNKIAELVQQAGQKVCVFPQNGTRRWFILNHGFPTKETFATQYLEKTTQRQAELCQMLFAHGLHSLLIPIFSKYLISRGEAYVQMAVEGMVSVCQHPDLRKLYREQRVQVKVYGDYESCFANTPYAYLIEMFQELEEETASNDQYRLWWGICAQDSTETVAQLSVAYYKANGRLPDKQTLIQQYYGTNLEPVDIYIGSGKPRAFDMPLVTTGREDLYFTVTPSLALNQTQLRHILYDHLYARQKSTSTYEQMQPQDWQNLEAFYNANQDHVIGIGAKQQEWGIWHPIPQIDLPH